MGILLKVDKLFGGYGRKTILLRDISFDIKRGEFLGIIGSGKSTLLKLMNRVLLPQGSKILFENKDITKMKLKELGRKIAFVPQDTLINFSFSVWEIVLMGRIPHFKRLQLETKKDFAVAENALLLTNSNKELHPYRWGIL